MEKIYWLQSYQNCKNLHVTHEKVLLYSYVEIFALGTQHNVLKGIMLDIV